MQLKWAKAHAHPPPICIMYAVLSVRSKGSAKSYKLVPNVLYARGNDAGQLLLSQLSVVVVVVADAQTR